MKSSSNINNNDTLLFHTEQGGVTPLLFSKKNNFMGCDLCKENVRALTPFDFSRYFWIQGEVIQRISKNKDLKRLNLELCCDCTKKIFDNSIITIRFNQDLFNALKNRGV